MAEFQFYGLDPRAARQALKEIEQKQRSWRLLVRRARKRKQVSDIYKPLWDRYDRAMRGRKHRPSRAEWMAERVLRKELDLKSLIRAVAPSHMAVMKDGTPVFVETKRRAGASIRKSKVTTLDALSEAGIRCYTMDPINGLVPWGEAQRAAGRKGKKLDNRRMKQQRRTPFAPY